jgi:hypothetical protein
MFNSSLILQMLLNVYQGNVVFPCFLSIFLVIQIGNLPKHTDILTTDFQKSAITSEILTIPHFHCFRLWLQGCTIIAERDV